jgi:REP element-mobilizing transposase RayT
LPHFYPEGHTLFVTFCLQGAVPKSLYPPPTAHNAGQAFAWMDRYLDTTRKGPFYLRRADVAGVVVKAIHFCEQPLQYYKLDSFVVMPNHVHLLVDPLVRPTPFLRTLKSHSAKESNRLLGRSGPFWQAESYDHVVRNEGELSRIRAYIEDNPVRALLAGVPHEYPYSSAHERFRQG